MKHQSAFPWTVDDGETVKGEKGMTLRDYFATKALPPIMHAGASRWDDGNYEIHAERAYKYADAMLKERMK
jgi:hypothetical protein